MEFFNWVDRTLQTQKVIEFPPVGLDYLNSNSYPEDDPKFLIHQAIISLIQSIAPKRDDVIVRQFIIDKLCQKIHQTLDDQISNQKVMAYPCGSCLNGTFLPEADIDIAVFSYPFPFNPVQVLNQLKVGLEKEAIPQSFFAIPQTKVPLLKMSVEPGIQVDISVDEFHGPLSVASIRKIFQDIPCILPAQLFLKCLLHIYGLDMPYVGGISSYTLQIMILAYVQHHGIPPNITELILGFCNFYGRIFNFILTGIEVSNAGCFFSREERNCICFESPLTMYIIDPLNPSNILGQNAFKVNEIRKAFRDVEDLIRSGDVSKFQALFNPIIESLNEIRNKEANFSIKNNLS